MKKNIKIEGKTIAAFVLVAVVLTGGIFMFSGRANALIQAVHEENYDGGGSGGSGSYTPPTTTTPTPAPANSGWPSAGGSTQISSCPNGLVVTRSAYCSGTTLVVEDYHTAWTSPGYEQCDDQYGGNCSWIGEVVNAAYTTSVGSVANSSECPVSCNSAANACGATASGSQINGVCNAVTPSNPANYGTACTSSANSCGTTNSGTIKCDGTCSATAPSNPVNYGTSCNSTANNCGTTNSGTIKCDGTCSATAPANPTTYGTACSSAANSCGTKANGTINCSGTCSAAVPANPASYGTACNSTANSCGTTNSGTIKCDGTCSAPVPLNPAGYGTACTSAANSCGTKSNGTINCSRTCSASVPLNPAGYGTACTSAANSCGQTNSGVIGCNGCTAVKPSDAACTTCRSPSNACGGFTTGITLTNGTCSVTVAPAVNLSTNPKYGQVCTVSNSCGQSASGTYLCANLGCSATAPANPTSYGTSCKSAANSCGATNTGTIKCDGTCTATKPANPVNMGTACTSAANACGTKATGTISCDGTCSATTPANPATLGTSCASAANTCGATNTGTIKCDGTCTATKPANPVNMGTACSSAANACGTKATGTISCDGTCSATAPANPVGYGTSCSSAANKCGMINTGTLNCSGICTALVPADSLCPVPCTSSPNACGQTTAGVSVNGVCNAVAPLNPNPIPCTTEANACGMTTTGTKACAFSSCLPKVANSACPPSSCNSTPNACGEVGTGTIVGGVCNAVTPANPQIFINTGSCIASPVIEGACSLSSVNGCLGGSIFSDRLDSGADNLWTCRGLNGGKDAACAIPKSPAIKPTVTINPVSNNLQAGQSTSFTWSVSNATWCDRYINSVFDKSISNIGGTFNSLSLFTTTSYDIQCGNDNGNPPSLTTGTHIANVAAIATPVITINPAVSNITSGDQATFSWTVTNSTTCRLYKDGQYIRIAGAVDSYSTGPLSSNATYAVSCVNEFGPGPIYPTAAKDHNVFVATIPPGPPILNFSRPVFSDTPFGEINTQLLTIRNDGDQDLTGDVSITSDQANVFSLSSNKVTFSLQKGESASFDVKFAPKRSVGANNAMIRKVRNVASSVFALSSPIRIRNDAAILIKNNSLSGDQSIPINGTGVDALSGDNNLNVGDAPVGLSRTYNYRVDNNTLLRSTACLTLNSANVFLIGTSKTAEKVISARAYELFNIVFKPTAISMFTDTLSVGVRQLDGSCKGIYDVNVTGNGVKPISDFKER